MHPKAIIAYVPVIHAGYASFFAKHSDVQFIGLITPEFAKNSRILQKDLRALPAEIIAKMIQQLDGLHNMTVEPLSDTLLRTITRRSAAILLPNEQISRQFAQDYLFDKRVEYDSVFLRWDYDTASTPQDVMPDRCVRNDEPAMRLMRRAFELAEQSADWWRQTGGVLVARSGEVVEGSNIHLPQEQTPYINGDPRGLFSRGYDIEMTSALHTEQRLISEAARRGIATDGASITITTFPCPWCAKAIAYAGVKQVFYAEGYSVLDAVDILEVFQVEMILVQK